MENGKRLKNRRLLIIGCMIAGLLAGMASSAFAKGNQVFFRGGGAFLSENRGGQIFTDTGNVTGAGFNNDENGFYVGGGVELVLSNDVWGFIPKTTVLGEIGVEYRRFDSKEVLQATSAICQGTTMSFRHGPSAVHCRYREGATHDAERQRLAQDQVQ